MKNFSRRDFIKFLGVTGLTTSQLALLGNLSSCSIAPDKSNIFPSTEDDLVLAKGFNYELLISWGDKINDKEVFGFNNDYLAIIPIEHDEVLMWVNHEYFNKVFVSSQQRTKENIDKERAMVGGSIISLKLSDGKWKFNPSSQYNKGVRGHTPIKFNNNVKVRGSNTAIGTLANCAGGVTPWKTFLTCEENYQYFYGERDRKTDKISSTRDKWETFYPNPPEHYGWVVEIDPKTAIAKKHTNLGRFSHESATCAKAKNGKVVVYSGDDKADEHLYKFISESDKDFDKGVLYVADITKGKWVPLDLELSPILKTKFSSQLEVVTYAREASKLLGATPLNRPEDIEIHPQTKDVYLTLTNNKKKGDYHGSILKLSEKGQDHASLSFETETYLMGGKEGELTCPDNLAFDKNGNLWVVTDMSGSAIGKEPYKSFGNNGLFVIPSAGTDIGKIIQVGSAPNDAELTGLCFSEDYKSLFLSVQHPGEMTKDLNNPTSHWPTGSLPKPSVVVITGEELEKYTLS